MLADHVIYCVQPWCARASRLTRAQLFIGLNGQPRMPACCDCATALQSLEPQPVELWYIDDDLRAQWWAAIDGAIGGGTPPTPEPPAPAAVPDPEPAGRNRIPRGPWIAGACALASLILGIAMVSIATAEWSNYVNGSQSGPPPDVGALKGWGIFFIVAPLVPVALAVILLILIGPIALACAHDEKQQRKAWEARQARGSVPASQGIPVSEIAATAALYGAWGVADYERRKHKEQARAALQAKSAAYRAEQDRRQQQATQVAILDQLRQLNTPAPPARGSLTPQSDIYGNVTYRKKPWP